MAEGRLRFGTQSSADVKLFLRGPGEKKDGKIPVYLHSQILKRLECFEGKFSNHRSSDKPTEIWVTTTYKFDHYLKCIEIMYDEPVDFLNVEECLAIMAIACEMPADDCIKKCMQYLQAVRWSAAQESRIREVLSFEGLDLKLKLSPDLAARLCQDDDNDHMIFVEKSIKEMVSLIECSRSPQSQKTVEKDLMEMLDGNASRDVVDVCGRVLLQEFKASVDSRSLSTVMRLFKPIQHCNRGILEAALKMFCENAEFSRFVKDQYGSLEIAEPAFDIVMWFMMATGEGKILISRVSRVSLLTTWLPIMGSFNYHRSLTYKFRQLDTAVLHMVESLPQVDQKRICLLWTEVYRLRNIDIATPFTLSKFLQNAH